MDRLNAFFAENPGCRLIARFEVAEPGTTEAQRGYYFGYIIPTVQAAMREQGTIWSESRTDIMLRSMCSDCYTDEGLLEVEQMSRSQLSDFIEWIKQFAAENLYIYIEDPKTI